MCPCNALKFLSYLLSLLSPLSQLESSAVFNRKLNYQSLRRHNKSAHGWNNCHRTKITIMEPLINEHPYCKGKIQHLCL